MGLKQLGSGCSVGVNERQVITLASANLLLPTIWDLRTVSVKACSIKSDFIVKWIGELNDCIIVCD